MTTPTPRYRLSHHPQVPFQPFEVEHHDLTVIVAVRDALADYDQFMLKYRHRRDFTNASYIEEKDPDSDDWWELEDDEIEYKLTAEDSDDYGPNFNRDYSYRDRDRNEWNFNGITERWDCRSPEGRYLFSFLGDNPPSEHSPYTRIEDKLDAAAARDRAEAEPLPDETYEEEDWRVVPFGEVDGRYVTRRYTRRVTPWTPDRTIEDTL